MAGQQMDFWSMEDGPAQSRDAPATRADGPVSARPRPLAARMRPRRLAEVVGQKHLLHEKSLLVRLVAKGQPGHLLFYGPPGCGKTTLAEVIAAETGQHLVRINAVQSNVAELRRVLDAARVRRGGGTIVFIDELHRFNKAQQDLLLPDVEEGVITLIGATTHNPGFYVIPPLLSRSQLFRLEPLREEEVEAVLERALQDEEHGLGKRRLRAGEGVLRSLARLADGDVRKALNALEVMAGWPEDGGLLTPEMVQNYAAERQIRYDAGEDEHYDTISAYIKSMRGGDPDAALYWLAKMLAGGEDPRFIARRLVILASEDVGMADPQALPLAVATFQACDFVGLPEAELHLAHTTVYLACAPKSNSTYLALAEAKRELRENPVQPVPVYLRDKGGEASKRLGHGQGYLYSHDFPEAFSGQAYWGETRPLYEPKESGAETAVARWWRERRAQREALKKEELRPKVAEQLRSKTAEQLRSDGQGEVDPPTL